MNTLRKSLRLLLGSGLLFASATLAGGDAEAGTATSNLSVTATVSDNCTISTAAVAFGSYDPVSVNLATPLDGTGTVTVTCTSGAAAKITLGQGANADVGSTDAIPTRRMNDGATNYISYLLYQESGHTTAWGNTAGTGVAHTGTGSSTGLTVYGRAAAAQNVPSGSYTDTVVATVTF